MRAIQHDTFMRAQTKSSLVASQVKSSQVKSSQGDEVTEGDENVSMQRAGGGSGSTGGIKKKKSKRRSRIEKSQKQRQDGKLPGGAREA